MEHPDTLLSMNNLAATYDSLGRATEAVKVCEECFEIRKRVLGLEHPDTLHSMNNLASIYASLGRAIEAVKLFEECFEIKRRVLRVKDPICCGQWEILTSINAVKGDIDATIIATKTATELDKTYAFAWAILGERVHN